MPESKTILDGINLLDGSVSAVKIKTNTITSMQLANAAVNNGAIQSFAVTEEKIAAAAVTADKIKDGSVTYGKLKFTKVFSEDYKIADGARNRFHYPISLPMDILFQPFRWKWLVTLLSVDGSYKNVCVRNCSNPDNTEEACVFWYDYYLFNADHYTLGVQVDNRTGTTVVARIELYRLD